MLRTARRSSLPLAAASLLLLGAGRLTADTVVVSPPGVAYYPPPAVACYSPPVAYAPAPAVSSYYPPPAPSYYAPAASYSTPAVSSYAAPAAVTTTRYGLFGRPRVRTTYYPPVYVGP